jgi:hypothetical protein
MEAVPVKIVPRGYGETERQDAWFIEPILVFVVFSSFLGYGTWAAMQNAHFEFGPYLSPFYSPLLFGTSHHAWFGARPGWFPEALFYPALLILPFPGLFRFTCYYYRGAYYKSFWADPPSCAVGEPRAGYRGERSLPLVLQNVHRYCLYLALLFLPILAWDVWKALWFTDPASGGTSFGVGVGTLVLLLNVVFLGGYTLGCHSLRHLVGGFLDSPSAAPARYAAYRCAGCFNRRHMAWAWTSLVWVAFSDLYVRLCSMGIWADWRIL